MDYSNKPGEEFSEGVQPLPGEEEMPAGNESVDEILKGIMKEDGTYRDEFNDLFSRYLGGSADDLRGIDISDRTGEDRPRGRVEFIEDTESPAAEEKSTSQRISEKLSPEVREIYSRETYDSVRPEFTNEGTVKYPTMGVGESEERVVYDADWEETAKKEAARREKIRRENMLRGDSAYTRSFRFSGADDRRGPNVNSAYIDPLDDSQDVPLFRPRPPVTRPEEPKDESPEEKDGEDRSFFQEGFSESQKINEAVSGKTEISLKDSSSDGIDTEAVNAAVLEAFSGDREIENEFRERWKDTVEQARLRREKKAAEEKRLLAVKRAEENQTESGRRLAAAEKLHLEGEIPLELDNLDQNRNFEEIPESTSGEDELYPEAEKIESLEKRSENIVIAKKPSEGGRKKKKRMTFKERMRKAYRDNIPMKGDPVKELIRKIIRCISFGALVGALIYLAVYGVKYYQRIKQTSDFEQQIEQLSELTGEELEDAWKDIKAQYPQVDFPDGMQIKFSHIYAVNQDLVGWLSIENTNISTPLLQTNNNDYYLYNDIYKRNSRYGNPFVSYNCKIGKEIGKNTIIYGHNTHDGLMFHQLTNYMRTEGYLNAPIVTLDTLYETTKWKIFAVMLTNSTSDMDNGYVFQYLYPEFSSDSSFLSKIKEIYSRSMIHTGVDVKADDKIITLYTCYQNNFSGGRLVVFARQLRDGESEEIDTSQVYYDTTARFPAAYYGKTKSQTEPGTTVKTEVTATSAAETTSSAAATEAVSEGVSVSETAAQGEETSAAAESTTQKPEESVSVLVSQSESQAA